MILPKNPKEFIHMNPTRTINKFSKVVGTRSHTKKQLYFSIPPVNNSKRKLRE